MKIMASNNCDHSHSSVHAHQKSSHLKNNKDFEMDTILLNAECRIHAGGQMNSFCEDHDVVICDDCVHNEHRKCESIVDLGKVSTGVKEQQEYKTASASLHNLKDDLIKLRLTRQDDKDRLVGEKQEVINKMQETAKQVQAMLKKFLQRGNAELEHRFREFEDEIDNELNDLAKTLEKVNKAIERLHEDDETEAFIEMKTNRNIGKEAKKKIKNISQHARKETLKFTVNPAFEKILSQNELGTLSFHSNNLPPRPRLFHEICEYDATLQGTYNVNIQDDAKTTCHILDSCLLNDGTMVLTDLPHNLVIHLDEAYKLKAFCELPGEPWGVCAINSKEIAVSLIGKQMVQFVTMETMTLKHSFDIGMPCRGVFFKDGNLYVVCGGGSSYWRSVMEGSGQIRVYNMQGKLIRTIQNDEMGKRLFGRPRDITLNPENNCLYITDETNGLIILSRSGQRVSIVKDKNLIAARGITFDSRGQALVGCFKSNQVLLFESDGALIHIPLSKAMNLSSVRSLCFKADSYRLIVTGHNDEIQVFDLARRY